MKFLMMILLALASLFSSSMALAGPFGFAGQKFVEVRYFAHGGTGSGESASNPAPISDQDVVALPLGTTVENVYVIVDTAITGTTNLDVGDDDDADGWVDGSLSVTLGTPGMYGWDAKLGGAYKRIQTAGATDAADIYVVPNAKFYAAAGKELKLDTTTASTAGAFRVVVEGTYFGR
jgi:hypothetical protein